MSTTKKLRLGPLPKTESVKLTFTCPASLKADLDRYAALHAQAYGEAVDAATLIPHMLEAFIAGDRGFRKGGKPEGGQTPRVHGKLNTCVTERKHWSEKTDSSISLTYQQIQKTERTVRLLGEIPTNNKHRTVTNAQQTKEVTMKKTNFKLSFVASWAVALSVFVGAGGAQYICARSNASLS